jgi:hypothetical protein
MSAAVSDCSCKNRARRGETFWYMAHKYLYDIDHAQRLVCDGREAVEVDDDSVEFSVRTSEINRKHVAKVDTSKPGIIAHIFYPAEDGEIIHGHLLIDGHHRAARCMQLKIPFFAHLLTEQESVDILLKCPAPPEVAVASD